MKIIIKIKENNIAEESELTETANKKIIAGLEDIQKGRVMSIEDYAKKRG